jgi:hypothetical protein
MPSQIELPPRAPRRGQTLAVKVLRLACVAAAISSCIPSAASAAQKGSGRNKYNSVTLQRGVTQNSSLSNWASGAKNPPKATQGKISVRRPTALTGSKP